MALDSEDDGHGRPSLFCVVHERGSYYHRDRAAVLEWLLLFTEGLWSEGRSPVCWCTNLEYDLVNLFGDRLMECSFRFGRSQLVSARWRHLEFRDTVRHLPASVKELGELVGLPKLGRDDTIAYCMRDARITYRAGAFIEGVYRPFGEHARATLPSTAYRIWSTQFWGFEIRLPSDRVLDWGSAAYYGGHTEAFFVGTFKRVHVVDAASMFPWAMTAGRFPIPWGLTKEYKRGDEISSEGVYHARLDCPVGCLPYRSTNGLVYPVGAFGGWYLGSDLLLATRLGARVSIKGGFEFLEYCDPFTGYVARLFALKNRARGIRRRVYKLMLNGLYGKFGQKGMVTRLVALSDLRRMKRPPDDYTIWQGMALFSEERKPPPWGNQIWAAIVTSRARVRLALELEKLRNAGVKVLYCDTDSVAFTGEARGYLQKANRPGDFEARGIYRQAVIVGKKEYALEVTPGNWRAYVKGIPEKARMDYLLNGSARFVRPVRMREAARRGLTPNEWRPFEKRRRATYQERIGPGGVLVPVHVEE